MTETPNVPQASGEQLDRIGVLYACNRDGRSDTEYREAILAKVTEKPERAF